MSPLGDETFFAHYKLGLLDQTALRGDMDFLLIKPSNVKVHYPRTEQTKIKMEGGHIALIHQYDVSPKCNAPATRIDMGRHSWPDLLELQSLLRGSRIAQPHHSLVVQYNETNTLHPSPRWGENSRPTTSPGKTIPNRNEAEK